MYIHYGKHTKIGDHFFANFNLTIQDDTWVTIGSYCSFGERYYSYPHSSNASHERRALLDKEGNPVHMCYAKPCISEMIAGWEQMLLSARE